MKFLLAFFIFFSSFTLGFSQSEWLESFHSEIEIKPNGNLLVKEQIEYHTEITGKRGIVRRLPLIRKDRNLTSFENDFDIIEVNRDGSSSEYHTERSNGYLLIYVGESDVFLDQGNTYSYELVYEIPYQIGFFEGYDELYWNVNGTDWDFPIQKISAQIDLPMGASIIQDACYTGPYGSTESNCSSTVNEKGIYFESLDARAGDNLSIAVGFTPNIVSKPPPPGWLQRYGGQLLAGIIGGVLLFYYLFTWIKWGIDPPKPTVIPLFSPPENLSPASVAMISKGYYWQDIATAAIVNLATKGFISIKDETSSSFFGVFKHNEYILVKEKNELDSLPKEERKLMEKLFKSSESITIDGKYDSDIASAMSQFQTNINSQWKSLIWKGFNGILWIFPILLIFLYFVLALSFQDYFVFEGKTALLVLFMIGNFIAFLIYQWLIRRPAERKLKLRAEIQGFKMYLGAAEERQLQHFNPPGMTPEIFEKYLPYAIALNVEGIWGDKFDNFLKRSTLAPSEYHPHWYNRPITSMGSFGHSLNSSLSNTLSSTSTKPQSSSGGSWSSGSGGGGFSGGGGGGGGGGSW